MLAYVGITAAVALGGIGLLVLIDPRTLPWLSGQVSAAWSALSAGVVSFFASLRQEP